MAGMGEEVARDFDWIMYRNLIIDLRTALLRLAIVCKDSSEALAICGEAMELIKEKVPDLGDPE
jgi:hypothetical protein